MHAGLQNGEPLLVEEAANACEERRLVHREDQELDAVAHAAGAGVHAGAALVGVRMQHLGVPGQVLRVMAQEVADVQRVPEGLVGIVGDAAFAQQPGSRLAAHVHLRGGTGGMAAEVGQRGPVQVFQQLALPGVPDPGAGAADVGDRKQIQGREPTGGLHPLGELRNHLGVGQIAFLGGHRHGEVLAHQKAQEPLVVARDAVGTAEAQHVALAQLRVVAAAPLGDVMKEGRHDQQPGRLEIAHQLAAEGVLVHVLGHHEAAQVAHHHQRVLVDRVDVEEVMLHAAHDVPEGRKIAPQHRPLVHQPQRVGDAWRGLQDGQEAGAVDRIVPVGAVDAEARMPEGAQRAHRHAVERAVLLQHTEGAQDQPGIALEVLRIAQVQLVVDLVEMVVQPAGRARMLAQQADLQRLQQQRAQLRDTLGRQVVLLHQLFREGARAFPLQVHGLGHGGLQVEDQPILAPARQDVQPGADALEEPLVALQLAGFQRLDDASAHQ